MTAAGLSIPNSDVYTSPVIVNTAFPTRRDQFDIGIGYGDKPDRAMRLFTDAIAAVDGVEREPAAEVLPWGLDASSVTLRARWWSKSKRTDIVHLRARVILAIWQTAADNGIDLPFPTQQILFHDQTEATDGDRTRQREGWPARRQPTGTAHFLSDDRGLDVRRIAATTEPSDGSACTEQGRAESRPSAPPQCRQAGSDEQRGQQTRPLQSNCRREAGRRGCGT